MSRNYAIITFLVCVITISVYSRKTVPAKEVPADTMQKVFEEVKTPYKYGVVLAAPDSTKMADSPTVFRMNGKWYMSYIIFDGRGYETWLAESDDLLHWTTKGRLMSFTENTWDASQKAGYPSLVDIIWNGTYEPMKYENKYWMSYLGGADKGYEAGRLGIGMSTTADISKAEEVLRFPAPVLSAIDDDVRWYDNKTIYKSSVIHDAEKKTGYPFIMYYNAAGDSTHEGHQFESIAMAASNDMKQWKRLGDRPLITKGRGICGDAQIVKMGKLYVMFYFGYNWYDGDHSAFERFACSYDLINWTPWEGENLIQPSVGFDKQYAHKPWVIKWNGVVYHFYNAVGDKGRVIALATSKDLSR
ncbi:MAG: glycosylase [Sphingobacteriales bacterium 40-81]|nr:MAG: glycosylase [Sphingobacteriales bacterium 40-81]